MPASVIYRNAALYETAMVLLYGRHYGARYRAIAGLIDPGASVLDVCCGPGILYRRYLSDKNVRYTGLDVSHKFIRGVNKAGAEGREWNVRSEQPLPEADYVIMQASLNHFLPDAKPVLLRMLRAARRFVIVAEPVRNLTSSSSSLVSTLGRRLTDPGDGQSAHRFDEQTLASFFEQWSDLVVSSFFIPGGREKVYVLDATPQRNGD